VRKFLLFIIFYFAIIFFSNVYAEEIVVIVNVQNNQHLNIQDIKNIYSDRIVKWENGNSINVINLPVESPVRDTFSKTILGVSASVAAAKEANRKITNRIKNPSVTKRASLVTAIVARSKNAIAYIPKSSLRKSDKIRVIHKIGE